MVLKRECNNARSGSGGEWTSVTDWDDCLQASEDVGDRVARGGVFVTLVAEACAGKR